MAAASDLYPRSIVSEFLNGCRGGIPAFVTSLPFGLLYGALAVQNGLSVGEATLMSATVFGGASQMVGIDLFGKQIPAWIVVLSIFAVNFRHVLYSAAIGRHMARWAGWQKALGFFFLTDPQYAEVERRSEAGVRTGFVFYLGMALALYIPWVLEAWAGATFGNRLPDTHAFGLDYLLPIYFLGLVMGFRGRPLWLPVVLTSGVMSIVAYNYVGTPWHVSLGALAGVLLAAILAPSKAAPLRDPEADDPGGGP